MTILQEINLKQLSFMTHLAPSWITYLSKWNKILLLLGTGDATKLNQVALPIIPRATCSKPDWWGTLLTENMICGGRQEQGIGACNVSA